MKIALFIILKCKQLKLKYEGRIQLISIINVCLQENFVFGKVSKM